MRKINFLNGLNAKSVLAVAIVAGFTLAGCEKEDFNVNVPDITVTVPDPYIPEAKDGVAYVVLTATSVSGNALDVTFTDASGASMDATKEYKEAKTFTVTASKDGYTPVVKTVIVPPLQKDVYLVITVDFVLSAVEAVAEPVQGDKLDVPSVPDSEDKAYTGNFEANKEYTFGAIAYTGTYYTAEQKTALLSKVDALTGPVTRAAEDDDNLKLAKQNLRDIINALPTEPATTTQTVTVVVKEAAKAITLSTTFLSDTYAVTFKTVVANKTYAVEGEQLVVVSNTIVSTAEGISVEHGHGHGHGGNDNAGGGTGGK